MKGFLPFLKPFRPRLASNSQKELTGKQNSQKFSCGIKQPNLG
jgi:hypothetical protein